MIVVAAIEAQLTENGAARKQTNNGWRRVVGTATDDRRNKVPAPLEGFVEVLLRVLVVVMVVVMVVVVEVVVVVIVVGVALVVVVVAAAVVVMVVV